MVHNFIPINAAPIKSNVPMPRIEPIRNRLSQARIKCYFSADASNGYYAVPLYEPHIYKTAFSTIIGQLAYRRMGQGFTGAAGTYAKLKDIVRGLISSPDPEPALWECNSKAVFGHFSDDDNGGAEDFESLVNFLDEHYFPRITWARLTLNPEKCEFFTATINLLGFRLEAGHLRPLLERAAAIAAFPIPVDEGSLNHLLWQLPWLSSMVPGRADLASLMKTALNMQLVAIPGSTRRRRQVVGFQWNEQADMA